MLQRKKRYKKCKRCGLKFSFLAFDVEVARREYCTRTCANKATANQNSVSKIGKKNPMFGKKPWNYKGVYVNVSGSRKVKYHQVLIEGRYKPLHRIIMEAQLGRELSIDEVVHHKDGNGLNNKISNLQVMKKSEHSKLHFNEIPRDSRTGRLLKNI